MSEEAKAQKRFTTFDLGPGECFVISISGLRGSAHRSNDQVRKIRDHLKGTGQESLLERILFRFGENEVRDSQHRKCVLVEIAGRNEWLCQKLADAVHGCPTVIPLKGNEQVDDRPEMIIKLRPGLMLYQPPQQEEEQMAEPSEDNAPADVEGV